MPPVWTDVLDLQIEIDDTTWESSPKPNNASEIAGAGRRAMAAARHNDVEKIAGS